jgi:hypothetical protein
VSYPARTVVIAVGKARKYTDQQLAEGLDRCRNMRQLLLFLGLAPQGGNYETVRSRIASLGLDGSHLRTFRQGRGLRECSPAEIELAVSEGRSFAEVMRKLNLRPGGTQARLKARVEALRLDTSHFLGAAWSRGRKLGPRKPIPPLLVPGRLIKTSRLRQRLILTGLKKPICEACLRGFWNGRPIPLELDHINGKRDDNRLRNLRLLCPNCHAQTSTYRGRNIGAVNGLS